VTTGSLTTRLVNVQILTECFNLEGTTKVTRTGLCGLLNDINKSTIDITDAKVTSLVDYPNSIQTYKLLKVQKKRILHVCLARMEDSGQKVIRQGYVNRILYNLNIYGFCFAYTGILEWQGPLDITVLLTERTSKYFAISSGEARSIIYPEFVSASPAIVINKDFISYIGYTYK
jgi:hypothetical protein